MRAVLLLVFITLACCDILDNAYDTILPGDENIVVPECNQNEVWMECASCEQKCGETPSPCPRVCQPAACRCPAHKGFKRNSAGQCVSTC